MSLFKDFGWVISRFYRLKRSAYGDRMNKIMRRNETIPSRYLEEVTALYAKRASQEVHRISLVRVRVVTSVV